VRQLFTIKRVVIVSALVAALVAVAVQLLNRPGTRLNEVLPPTAGSYAELTPGQRRLIDDWVNRLADAAGTPMNAAGLYDDLALSTRTTFTAVTHALAKTVIDEDGQTTTLTALDLIDRVDKVAGSDPGLGGDKQFRLYVELKPGVQATLEKSSAFKRQVDNTVYHKGYPTCFRGIGGTPSIQISISRDGRRGDIDVDYRSSTFPVMLINGHLTASNSDVRAGNNDERHNSHWTGLQDWWRGFMGVPAVEAPGAEVAAMAGKIATEPRLGKDTRPEEAVSDFLNAWLVEGNPGVAAGYIAPRAFACLEVEGGRVVDPGVARVQMARAMQSVGQLIGKPTTLTGVVSAVNLTGPRGRVAPQPHGELFAMYEIRDDLAAEFDCENRLHPELADQDALRSTRFSGAIGAVFRVQTPGVRGEVVATVWSQDNGVWKLVAYDTEPEVMRTGLAAATPPAPAPIEPALATSPGDPAMTRSARAFLDAWFVARDTQAAFRYLSPDSYACYDVFRSDDLPAAVSADEAGRLLQERMKAVAGLAGPATRLEDVLVPVAPHHPGLRLVTHDSSAFTLISLPDAMGAGLDCRNLAPGEIPWVDLDGAQTYGNYYAASTRLRRGGDDGAVLWSVWARQGGVWKITSYLVVTP
jgi:hypothetical protein